jgi:hypothetical protein
MVMMNECGFGILHTSIFFFCVWVYSIKLYKACINYSQAVRINHNSTTRVLQANLHGHPNVRLLQVLDQPFSHSATQWCFRPWERTLAFPIKA